MRSSLIWDVTQRRVIFTDVSGKPIGPIFKGKAVQEDWPLKMGTIGYPETSVTTNLGCVTSQESEDLRYLLM
jgi:hypothetical protein